jgi:hypothetical protein
VTQIRRPDSHFFCIDNLRGLVITSYQCSILLLQSFTFRSGSPSLLRSVITPRPKAELPRLQNKLSHLVLNERSAMWIKAAYYSTVFATIVALLAFVAFAMHWQDAPHLVSPWLLLLSLATFAWLFFFTILILEEMRRRDYLSLRDRTTDDLSWRSDPRKRRKVRRYAILVLLWICYICIATFLFIKVIPALTEAETSGSTANRHVINKKQ